MALIFRSEDKGPSPDLGSGTVDGAAELTKEERYRRAAASIQSWLDADDDSDLVVLEEMRAHLRLNPIELQK